TRGALHRAPALRPERLAGAMVYYDAQVDDARYTVTVARTAARHGAHIVTRASAVSLLRDGERVTGAVVRDEESGRTFDVHAARVIVCVGVWSDLVHQASGVRAGYQVRMSKGVHLVMPRSAIDADTGMIVRTSKSVLFFIPWDERWIVGTTDTDWSGDRAEPAATAEDVDYILREANRVLARPLTRADVLAVYAGLRPLVAEPATESRAADKAASSGDEAPHPRGDEKPARGGERALALRGGERVLRSGGERALRGGGKVLRISEKALRSGGEKALRGGGEKALRGGEKAPGGGERAPRGSEKAPRGGEKAGGAEKPTTKLSREHVVDTPLPGLASIAGGKFTTYRLMARDVVDAAV